MIGAFNDNMNNATFLRCNKFPSNIYKVSKYYTDGRISITLSFSDVQKWYVQIVGLVSGVQGGFFGSNVADEGQHSFAVYREKGTDIYSLYFTYNTPDNPDNMMLYWY